MSAMAISWYHYPSWLKDLQEKLPPDYVPVRPGELAQLFRAYVGGSGFAGRRRVQDAADDPGDGG